MVQDNTNKKYLSKNVEPDQISFWLKEYLVQLKSHLYFLTNCNRRLPCDQVTKLLSDVIRFLTQALVLAGS